MLGTSIFCVLFAMFGAMLCLIDVNILLAESNLYPGRLRQ